MFSYSRKGPKEHKYDEVLMGLKSDEIKKVTILTPHSSKIELSDGRIYKCYHNSQFSKMINNTNGLDFIKLVDKQSDGLDFRYKIKYKVYLK